MAENFQKGGKHYEKKQNCLLGAISPFSAVFPKDLYYRHVKTTACWERVKEVKERDDTAFRC